MNGTTLLQESAKPRPVGLDQLTVTGKLRNSGMPSATCQLFGILIADDEAGLVDEVARALEQFWFPIHRAIGGSQAVIVANARQPAAAVIDFALQDQHGIAAYLQIQRTCPDMQIVVITDSQCEQQAREAGFAVLSKPIDVPQLLRVFQRLTVAG